MALLRKATILAALLAGLFATDSAQAAEVCHFAGKTDFAGHVSAISDVATVNGTTTINVTARFGGTWLVLFHVHYLTQEITTWRSGRLEMVAVNNRYLIGNRVSRQQWDVFQRRDGGFEAYRIEGKTLTEFRRQFPYFAQYWNPATFGQPWLGDFQRASPQRRRDLDLKQAHPSSALQAPLALAFYWDRWLPWGTVDIPVFLPGFKHDRVAELTVATQGADTRTASVLYPALSRTRLSMVTAWQSPGRQVTQLALDLSTRGQTAEGIIRQQGCQGTP
ncbi:MAG: hypothetical protein JO122_11360 [Acetobacteraceae bacterium]|nr:hypothetical protein [Acetobacteraceae bacterium]